MSILNKVDWDNASYDETLTMLTKQALSKQAEGGLMDTLGGAWNSAKDTVSGWLPAQSQTPPVPGQPPPTPPPGGEGSSALKNILIGSAIGGGAGLVRGMGRKRKRYLSDIAGGAMLGGAGGAGLSLLQHIGSPGEKSSPQADPNLIKLNDTGVEVNPNFVNLPLGKRFQQLSAALAAARANKNQGAITELTQQLKDLGPDVETGANKPNWLGVTARNMGMPWVRAITDNENGGAHAAEGAGTLLGGYGGGYLANQGLRSGWNKAVNWWKVPGQQLKAYEDSIRTKGKEWTGTRLTTDPKLDKKLKQTIEDMLVADTGTIGKDGLPKSKVPNPKATRSMLDKLMFWKGKPKQDEILNVSRNHKGVDIRTKRVGTINSEIGKIQKNIEQLDAIIADPATTKTELNTAQVNKALQEAKLQKAQTKTLPEAERLLSKSTAEAELAAGTTKTNLKQMKGKMPAKQRVASKAGWKGNVLGMLGLNYVWANHLRERMLGSDYTNPGYHDYMQNNASPDAMTNQRLQKYFD